ncbi:MAG: DUF4178 domain-containing protein [Leptospiraceae bacterium]|nr:DUF4178 domain-containing protein [Leptospiraceae bacterium]
MEEPKRPFVKTFSCPNCAGSVTIRAIGSSINVVCSYCSSIIDTNDENYKVVDTFTNKIKRRQVIGLGQRGELFGTLWETIGYMERVEQTGNYTWSEYLLFNPLKGFRWLTEYGGHWSFVTTIKDTPELYPNVGNNSGTELAVPNYAYHKNTSYQIFSNGTAKVTFVIGEFYWQVRVGEIVNMQEFIAPPETLSLEKNAEERIWSVGVYTNADTIKNAFQVELPMPFQTGIAPNQPSPHGADTAVKVKKLWKYFAFTILIIQIGFCLGNKTEELYKGTMVFSANEKTKVTPPFEINMETTTLEINFSSPVENSWIEIGGELVNDGNGDTVEFEQGIEYYSGTDSDGAWSEGSTSASEKIPSISKGKYHLNIEVSAPSLESNTKNLFTSADNLGKPVTVLVEIKTGGLLWSNFIFALIFISVFPIYIAWRSRRFEVNRWSESDFSPYNSFDSDEDDE